MKTKKNTKNEVSVVFVPPGGGEAEYEEILNLDVIPREGEELRFWESGVRSRDFIVRRVVHVFNTTYNEEGCSSEPHCITVEAEYAIAATSSDAHLKDCQKFASRGLEVREIVASGY